MKRDKEQFLTKSQLKERGWNDGLIDRFLTSPDDERENPNYRTGPPMKLYRVRRVEEAEGLAEFQQVQEERNNRREAARKGIETKSRKTKEYVESVSIDVPALEKADLIRRACEHYNAGRYGDQMAFPDSDPAFVERLCVNYLRHCLTPYEDHLAAISGRVGVADAYLEIKTKTLQAIAETYEWLDDESGH